MRQLLIWCATRAIGEKPKGGSDPDEQSARLAGKLILSSDYPMKQKLMSISASNPRGGPPGVFK